MRGIVLAAGSGTRLMPLTAGRPKPMVPIAGRPAISYVLDWLANQDVREVAINLHHYPDILRAHVGDGSGFGLRVTYSIESEILGTSGALRPLHEFFRGQDEFLVVYGDVITDLHIGELVELHRAAGADATLVLTHVEDPTRAGMVVLGPENRIERIVEKPLPDQVCSDWANAGIYVCGQSVLEYVPASGYQDFACHLFPAMLADGRRLLGAPADGPVFDYGSLDRLEAAGAWIRGKPSSLVEARNPC